MSVLNGNVERVAHSVWLTAAGRLLIPVLTGLAIWALTAILDTRSQVAAVQADLANFKTFIDGRIQLRAALEAEQNLRLGAHEVRINAASDKLSTHETRIDRLEHRPN